MEEIKRDDDLVVSFKELEIDSMINLISDTVTKPTPGMLEAMMNAAVGDDVFGEDPTVKELENRLARMFGKERGLFCPTGTMSNQLALKCHTQPMDEVICDENSHIYHYENGGYAMHSGISIQLLPGHNGIITKEQVEKAIKPDYDWLPRTRLVVLENSANRAGGNYYTRDEIRPISEFCRSNDLKIHLDGARLFNVLVETGDTTEEVGTLFDSISICLSKGLGAPAGTVLLGEEDFIKQARRWRKAMGGGMRQSGYLAAAGLYALKHHIDRLKIDNARAKKLGAVLSECDYVAQVRSVKTNIVIFDLVQEVPATLLLEYFRSKGMNASAFAPHTVRLVTHLDITDDMISQAIEIIRSFKK